MAKCRQERRRVPVHFNKILNDAGEGDKLGVGVLSYEERCGHFVISTVHLRFEYDGRDWHGVEAVMGAIQRGDELVMRVVQGDRLQARGRGNEVGLGAGMFPPVRQVVERLELLELLRPVDWFPVGPNGDFSETE